MFKLVFAAAKGEFAKAIDALQAPIARAATAAIKEIGEQEIKPGWAAAIAKAGFGPRWQKAISIEYYPKKGNSMGPALFAHHKIPYAGVFEEGAKISGKPMLWLPIKQNIPGRIGNRAMTPRNFERFVGPLHTIRVSGKPPMLGAYMRGKEGSKVTLGKLRSGSALARLGVRSRRGRHGGVGVVSIPVFIGVPMINISPRFGAAKVTQASMDKLPKTFADKLRRG